MPAASGRCRATNTPSAPLSLSGAAARVSTRPPGAVTRTFTVASGSGSNPAPRAETRQAIDSPDEADGGAVRLTGSVAWSASQLTAWRQNVSYDRSAAGNIIRQRHDASPVNTIER